ncbi:MAG: endonuclease/exonuclease/phosphatase family protein [Planctomycetota bacterium]
MKIATWNLQRPAMSGARVESLKQTMSKIKAEVWILTETRDNIDLSNHGYQVAASETIESMHRPGEHRTTIWSRYHIVKRIKTHCSATAVCAELKGTPIGPCMIYGTIIPYCGAGSRYHYQYAGKNRVGEKGWNLHYESIALHQKDLLRLKQQFPKHRIFFAGDFNQSRDGRTWWNSARQWYGTQQGRSQLTECLDASGLRCVTEVDFVKMGKITTMSTVDHICVDDRVASKISAVGGWDAPLIDGKRSSDHCGVWVTLASAQA